MAKQVGPLAELDLKSLNGYVFAWRKSTGQPQLIDIEGRYFVSIYGDEADLDAGMQSLEVTDYTVKEINDGPDFAASIKEGRRGHLHQRSTRTRTQRAALHRGRATAMRAKTERQPSPESSALIEALIEAVWQNPVLPLANRTVLSAQRRLERHVARLEHRAMGPSARKGTPSSEGR